jgi:hypothetical protein
MLKKYYMLIFIALSLNAADDTKGRHMISVCGKTISLKEFFQCIPDRQLPFATTQKTFVAPNKLMIFLHKRELSLKKEDIDKAFIYWQNPKTDILLCDTDTRTTEKIASDILGRERSFLRPYLIYNEKRKLLFFELLQQLHKGILIRDLNDPNKSRYIPESGELVGFSKNEKYLLYAKSDEKQPANAATLNKDNEIRFLNIDELTNIDDLPIDSTKTITTPAYRNYYDGNNREYKTAHHADKKLIACQSDRNDIAFIRDYSKTHHEHLHIDFEKDGITSIDFNNDGTLLLCSTFKGKIFIWNTENLQLIAQTDINENFKTKKCWINQGPYYESQFINNSLALCINNKKLYTIENNSIRIIDNE